MNNTVFNEEVNVIILNGKVNYCSDIAHLMVLMVSLKVESAC